MQQLYLELRLHIDPSSLTAVMSLSQQRQKRSGILLCGQDLEELRLNCITRRLRGDSCRRCLPLVVGGCNYISQSIARRVGPHEAFIGSDDRRALGLLSANQQ